MGFFDKPLFDFDGDGKTDALEMMAGIEIMELCRREITNHRSDNTCYTRDNKYDDDEEDD